MGTSSQEEHCPSQLSLDRRLALPSDRMSERQSITGEDLLALKEQGKATPKTAIGAPECTVNNVIQEDEPIWVVFEENGR